MKTITVGGLRQNPTAMLADVESGETYQVTRHRRGIAYVVPPTAGIELIPRRRSSGSQLATMPRHELRTARSVDDLLADERDR